MVDVNSLISGVTEYAKLNRYKVDIFPPNTMINGTSQGEANVFGGLLESLVSDIEGYVTGTQNGYGDPRAINLSCSAVSMPGVSYATKEIRTGKGPLHKIPYDKIYEPITATFYVDIDHNTRRFFLDWINMIDQPTEQVDKDGNHYQFYNNYIGGMYIYQLDAKQLPSHLVYVEELYPTNVGEIALAYESTDAVATFTVTFNYRRFSQKPVNRLAANILDNIL